MLWGYGSIMIGCQAIPGHWWRLNVYHSLVHSRGETIAPHAGLWPELALINHSCLPNALPMVVGDRIVLR